MAFVWPLRLHTMHVKSRLLLPYHFSYLLPRTLMQRTLCRAEQNASTLGLLFSLSQHNLNQLCARLCFDRILPLSCVHVFTTSTGYSHVLFDTHFYNLYNYLSNHQYRIHVYLGKY